MKTLFLSSLTAAALATLPLTAALAQAANPAPAVQFTKPQSDAVLSKDLIGLNLYNGANQDVGEIKDLVLDNGALKGYILSVGGFLGMGTHYVAVSPSSIAVNYDANDKKWQGKINATKDQLKSAPEFTYQGPQNH